MNLHIAQWVHYGRPALPQWRLPEPNELKCWWVWRWWNAHMCDGRSSQAGLELNACEHAVVTVEIRTAHDLRGHLSCRRRHRPASTLTRALRVLTPPLLTWRTIARRCDRQRWHCGIWCGGGGRSRCYAARLLDDFHRAKLGTAFQMCAAIRVERPKSVWEIVREQVVHGGKTSGRITGKARSQHTQQVRVFQPQGT